MRVDDVISGREGLAGVQWLLQGRQPLAALQSLLRGMLLAPGSLADCRLTRAKFRSGHKLTACFDVSLRAAKTAPPRTRPVVVTWSKPKKDGRPRDVAECSLQAEAERRGASAPFRELTGGAPDWNMRVDVAPLDRRFPQLVRLSDPAYAGEVLGAHGQVPEIGWVRYRPGQRHVLRYDVAPGDGRVPIFLKLYEADDARRAYEDLARICDWLAARHSDVASLRAASLLEADCALTFPQVRGTPLSAYLERPNPWLPWLLERTGAALRILQSAPPQLAAAGGRRDFDAQAEATARTTEHRAALLPPAGDVLQDLLHRARRLNERIPSGPERFAHGDMKTAHVYVTDRDLTLIDFDSRCLADPGYDPGKFLADLEWQLWSRGAATVGQAQAHFLAGYAPEPELLARVRLWQAVMMAHLGWRRLQLFRPDSEAVLDCMLNRADRILRLLERDF